MKHKIRPADSPQGGRWDDSRFARARPLLVIGGVGKEQTGSVEVWSTGSSDNTNAPASASPAKGDAAGNDSTGRRPRRTSDPSSEREHHRLFA